MRPPDEDPPIFREVAARHPVLRFDPPTMAIPPVRRLDEAAPPDDADAGLGGHLGTVTDREWLAAHLRLMNAGDDLAPELDYIWDPDRDGADLVDVAESDMAQRPSRYDPNTDERFHGGGFRG